MHIDVTRYRSHLFPTLFVASALFIPAATPAPAAAAPETAARDLLKQAGVAGGLVVHAGRGNGALTAALGAAGPYLVQGLDPNRADVEKARARIRTAGRYGPVAADLLRGGRLPCADGLVNLVVRDTPGIVSTAEVMRVLCPGGVAMTRDGGRWKKTVKPVPAEIDDWPHALYGPDNNAVSGDTAVGPPHRLRWTAPPRNARHHERLASVSVLVAGGGRIYYIIDESPAASILIEPQWQLVARDGFSGVRLWNRAVASWENHLRGFRSGPPDLARRLVAAGDRVYATLGCGEPVTALDGATGKTLGTYAQTAGTEEIRHVDGTLFLVIERSDGGPKDIAVVDAESGRQRWRKKGADPLPTTLAIDGGKVFYQDGTHLVCLDAETGSPRWKTPRPAATKRPGWSAPTVVARDGVVLSADRLPAPDPATMKEARKHFAGWLVDQGQPGELIAFSAENGTELWRRTCAEAYHAPVDVFVIDGLVWVGESPSRTGPDFTRGRDLRTGAVERRIDPARAFKTTMPHHRCHRNRVAGHSIIAGRTGVEFIDVRSGEAIRHHWTRGVCQYGTVPANGLLYVPPHSCACYIEAKMTGFCAYAPKREQPRKTEKKHAGRLVRGPAYGNVGHDDAGEVGDGDWPTYRHDAARSGATAAAVPVELGVSWSVAAGGRLSAPVIAGGRVYVAAIDARAVRALDADTGKPLWTFTAGGRVDSPPTVRGGRVWFGAADGRVYCLRAADGRRVWEFRAAPADTRIVASGQLESAWPVHGSVLVDEKGLYCAAGRSSFIDGGLYLYRLDPASGKPLASRRIYSRDPSSGAQPEEPQMFEMTGALPDVLSSDGERVYMRRMTMDPAGLEKTAVRAHLYSPAGFLNGDWWHRTYWIYGTHFYSGYIGWYFAGRETPAGRLLAIDGKSIYGFGYTPAYYRGATGREYHLFAIDRDTVPAQPPSAYDRARRDYPPRGKRKFTVDYRWTARPPLLARALVAAGDRLFLAGPPRRALKSLSAFGGAEGGRLQVVAAADGTLLADYRLAALPVHDGMAAAGGNLYLSARDGRLIRLGKPSGEDDKTSPLISPYAATVERPEDRPEPGLTGYWPFDEGKGSTAFDRSGGKHDAEVAGRWAPGIRGTAVASGPTPGAVVIKDGDHLRFGTGGFTVAFWIRLERFGGRLMGKEDFPRRWWVVNILDNGRLELVLGQGRGKGQSVRPRSKTPLPRRQWAHVAFVVDREAGRVDCYRDGKPDGGAKIPASFTAPLDVKGNDLKIPPSHKPFTGRIDELRIYTRPLKKAAIAALSATQETEDR